MRAEVFLKEQFKRLEKEQIFVYISHGNHDPLTEKITNDWPDNVSVFSNRVETYQAITKDGETILFMVLVINMIQVMKIKLMSIHLAKVKRYSYWNVTRYL